MTKWLEAYAQWPPTNQMVFSLAVLIAVTGLAVGVGILSVRLLAMHHARPVRPTPAIVSKEIRNMLVQVLHPEAAGFDWTSEQKAIARETCLQAELQHKVAEEMPQAGVGQPLAKGRVA